MNQTDKNRMETELDTLQKEYNELWSELANVDIKIHDHPVGSCSDYMNEIVKRMSEVRSARNTIQWILWKSFIGSPLETSSSKLRMLRQVYAQKTKSSDK